MSLKLYEYISENVLKYLAKIHNILNQPDDFSSSNLPLLKQISLMNVNETRQEDVLGDYINLNVTLKSLNAEIIMQSITLIFDYTIYVIENHRRFTSPNELHKMIKDLLKWIRTYETHSLLNKEAAEDHIKDCVNKLMNLVMYKWENYNIQDNSVQTYYKLLIIFKPEEGIKDLIVRKCIDHLKALNNANTPAKSLKGNDLESFVSFVFLLREILQDIAYDVRNLSNSFLEDLNNLKVHLESLRDLIPRFVLYTVNKCNYLIENITQMK